MRNTPYQAIVFDAVGTLIFPEPAAPIVYAQVGRRHGSRLTDDVIRSRFRAAFARQEALDRDAGLRTSEERERLRWQAIVAEVLTDLTSPAACFEELFAHFASPAAWRCEEGAGDILQGLADQGNQLALASNYDSRLRRVVAGLPPLQPIRQLVISSEIGCRKPAREFFEHTCRLLGLPPARVLVVGDDRANDCEGARAAGMPAILFDPQGKAPEDGLQRIASLTELPAWLASR